MLLHPIAAATPFYHHSTKETTMDNQHQKITGYRDLSQAEIDAMNKVKALGPQLESLLKEIRAIPDVDQRWAAISQTDFQTACMALIRAVARPTTFC